MRHCILAAYGFCTDVARFRVLVTGRVARITVGVPDRRGTREMIILGAPVPPGTGRRKGV